MKSKFSLKRIIPILVILLSFLGCTPPKENDQTPTRPNIVWIMLEDWGYQLSCYGEKGIETPNVDKVGGYPVCQFFCHRSGMLTFPFRYDDRLSSKLYLSKST